MTTLRQRREKWRAAIDSREAQPSEAVVTAFVAFKEAGFREAVEACAEWLSQPVGSDVMTTAELVEAMRADLLREDE
jgi:hypothetical protein